MVDRTQYADDAHTPKIALRQIFGRLALRPGLCRSAADAGLLTVEVFAMLGDAAATVKDTLRNVIPTDELGATEAAKELALMQLAAVCLEHPTMPRGHHFQQTKRFGIERSHLCPTISFVSALDMSIFSHIAMGREPCRPSMEKSGRYYRKCHMGVAGEENEILAREQQRLQRAHDTASPKRGRTWAATGLV